MSTYKKYLSLVTEENQFLDYQEAKTYLDNMVRTGQIQSYDESVLNKIKKGISAAALVALLSGSGLKAGQNNNIIQPKIDTNNIEMVINVKKDLHKIELGVTSLERHTENFQKASNQYETELANIEKTINSLKENKSFDQSKLNYYQQRIDGIRSYLEKGKEVITVFDKEMKKMKEENDAFIKAMKRNQDNQKSIE
jgi:chromosome segregation ATPase